MEKEETCFCLQVNKMWGRLQRFIVPFFHFAMIHLIATYVLLIDGYTIFFSFTRNKPSAVRRTWGK